MEGEGDWVPWGCHRTQWDRNREEKVNGVLSWLELKNMKDIRKFLDLVNYYRRFIKDFA